MIGEKKFIDCTFFNDELDMLEIRFNELDSIADFFVVVEDNKTFSNKPKTYHLADNKKRFEKFWNKLILIHPNIEWNGDAWHSERSSRRATREGIEILLEKGIIDGEDLLIGNDTGPTHMAWGLNVPSITLFGPTPVSRVYQTDINKVLKSPSIVNPFKLNKQDFSIQEIAEQDVIQLAELLLRY